MCHQQVTRCNSKVNSGIICAVLNDHDWHALWPVLGNTGEKTQEDMSLNTAVVFFLIPHSYVHMYV